VKNGKVDIIDVRLLFQRKGNHHQDYTKRQNIIKLLSVSFEVLAHQSHEITHHTSHITHRTSHITSHHITSHHITSHHVRAFETQEEEAAIVNSVFGGRNGKQHCGIGIVIAIATTKKY
jgi:hypothetical protein